MRRLFMVGVIAGALFGIPGIASAQTASTAQAAAAAPATALAPSICPSSPTGTAHSAFGGQVTVRVLFLSANGGTNCVWAVKNVSVGTAETQLMDVGFYRCNSGNPATTSCTLVETDPGFWTRWAGPVGATNMAGRCIQVDVLFRGNFTIQGPYHCG